MAESLGEALLYLRTDDTGLNAGMQRAHQGAEQVGAAFDKTSASSDRLSREMTAAGGAAARTGAQFQQTSGEVTRASGMQRQGMQQLGMQLGDISTMYALGARPMQIFASQSGQVLQAVQMMTGGTSKLAAFLGGPWGIAAMVAAQALIPLIGKLFETEQGMEKVESAAERAASSMKKMWEELSQASATSNAATENVIMLANSMGKVAQLEKELAQLRATRADLVRTPGGAQMVQGYDARIVALDTQLQEARSQRDTARQNLDDLKGAAVVRERQRRNEERLNGSGDSAGGGRGNGRATGRADRVDPQAAARIEARQADELGRLGMEELRARLALTTDVHERADIQRELLMLERAERVRRIEGDVDLDRAQKDAQIAYIDRLYGKPDSGNGANGEILVTPNTSLQGQAIQRELDERASQMANDTIRMQIDALDAQAGITTNLERRNELEERALQLQQQIDRNLLEQDIANGRVADADQARALLAEQQAADRAGLARSQRGPLEQYRDQMRETAENMGTEIEQIEVEGLQKLNDGLTDAIMGARSLGDVFSDVAEQIVRDLIRISLQRSLIEPLAALLMGGGGGGANGGGGGGIFGTIVGAALGRFGSGGNGAFQGFFANGGLIPTGSFGIVGERGPEPVIGTGNGAMVLPNSSLRGGALGGGNGPSAIHVTVSGARGNAEIEDMVRSGVQQGIAGYDRVVLNRVQEHQARRG